jgi:hypothetical protein
VKRGRKISTSRGFDPPFGRQMEVTSRSGGEDLFGALGRAQTVVGVGGEGVDGGGVNRKERPMGRSGRRG